MRISCGLALAGAVVLMGTAGCSSDTTADPPVAEGITTAANAETPAAVAPAASPEDQLREAAENLDRLAANGESAAAYEYYSQRCKNIIGSLAAYDSMLDLIFAGRTPEYAGVTVRINGSSAQVVTVDNSPTAPASAMNPRTWTFIDDRWQFDNC